MGTEIDNDVACVLAQAMLDGLPATINGRPIVCLELITAAFDIIATQAASSFKGTPEEAWADLFQNLRLKERFVQLMTIERVMKRP
jgi:hypothetical protein